jgi:hypothetical protein
MCNTVIRVCTKGPDYSNLPSFQYDWSRSVYGELTEEVPPTDSPPPLGKHVTLTQCVDAKLTHDVIMGRSVTGILRLANKTPIIWFWLATVFVCE